MDTGSNISIVRPDLLQGMSESLIQPVNSCLRTVTGEKAPIRGRCKLQLGLGTREITQEMWVADIHDQCILGLDFLQPHSCQVNLRDGALLIGEEEIPLKRSSATPEAACFKAVLLDGVSIPPLSEAVVPVKVECTRAEAEWAILEQSPAQNLSVHWMGY